MSINNNKDPENGKMNNDEDDNGLVTEFPKCIDKSCIDILFFPSKLFDWLKFKFPAIMFTIFMLIEKFNFGTDVR